MATFVGYGLAFVTSIIQARVLGADGRGIVASAAAPAALVGMLLCINTPDFFGRQAAKGIDANALSRSAAGVSGLLGATFLIPSLLAISLWQTPGSQVWILLVLYLLVLPVTIYFYNLGAIAAGRADWLGLSIARVLPGLLSICALVVAAVEGWGPVAVGMAVLVSNLLGGVIPLLRARTLPATGPWLTREFEPLRYGIRAWPAGALALVSQRIDLLVVVGLATYAEVGIYSLATSVAAVLTAVSNVVAIPARNSVAKGDLSQVADRVGLAMWSTGGLVVMGALALPTFTRVVLGPQFSGLGLVGTILMVAEIPLAGAVVLNQVLLGVGMPTKPLVGAAAAAITTGLGAILIYPIGGLTGVAIACVLGNTANFLSLLSAVHRNVKPSPIWHYIKPFRRRQEI